MIKIINKYWFYLLGLFLLISCDPSPTGGIEHEIPGVKWEISEAKESYAVGETFEFSITFSPDFVKFEKYRLGFNVFVQGNSSMTQEAILIKQNISMMTDCTTEEIIIDSYYDVVDGKINLRFIAEAKKRGRYYISTYLYGNQKKITNYSYITRQRIPIIIE